MVNYLYILDSISLYIIKLNSYFVFKYLSNRIHLKNLADKKSKSGNRNSE